MAKIKLQNVRISYPSLFRKATFQGAETKYEATFLLNKDTHAAIIAAIKAEINEGIKTNLKGAKVAADKICFKDGDLTDSAGYENCYSLKAATNKRPMVIDRDRSPLAEEDNRIYAGCYVNAMIEFWYMDNAYGKRVCATLLAVQFAKDGEPLGGGTGASVDDFDVLLDDDDSAFI